MKKINLKEDSSIKSYIDEIYLSAFPEEERPPLDFMYHYFYLNDNNQIYAYFNNDEFIGFTYLSSYKDVIYLAFFAVNESKRNKGYGAKILSDIKETYKDKTILLAFEEVDEKYKDYPLRKRRKNFYLRNGFIENHIKTKEADVIYDTAYNGKEKVSYETYKIIFDQVYGVGASKKYLKRVF